MKYLFFAYIWVFLAGCIHQIEDTDLVQEVYTYPPNREAEIECVNRTLELASRNIPKDFRLVKEFPFFTSLCRSKRERKLILHQGITYWFGINTPSNSPKGMIGILYDRDLNRIAGTLALDKFRNGFLFQCNRTGEYLFSVAFKNYSSEGCPAHLSKTNRVVVSAILGMKKTKG